MLQQQESGDLIRKKLMDSFNKTRRLGRSSQRQQGECAQLAGRVPPEMWPWPNASGRSR